ncbi:META domain-containing protein [Corynebacterium afermentans subsp. lipophilum]|uniref:META domain-containing protein n=1 Tax=Corynebacterium afermentans TaxID=38286 RepID=UPI00188DAB5E|nr:META domain-containing protein [Corynebacterium afermentans]MBF4548363.1 META domain-containing protein [Corynebacterium afermentans subsp. lipophilum]
MVTSTKTLKKLSTTTAVVALTGGLLGVGTADAQERPETSSIDQFVQMSSNLFGDLGGTPAPAPAPVPENPAGSELIQQLPEGADQLKDDRLTAALDTALQAKNNNTITLDFRENGVLHSNDGCNSGTAKYQIDNTGALHLSDFTETKMACEPGAQKDADDLKMVLQSNPQLFQLDASTLFLAGQGHGIELQKMHGRDYQ